MYKIEYYEHMLRLYGATGEKIAKIRWHFVRDVRPSVVLDYGAGLGWFRAMRPMGLDVDSFDLDEFPVSHTGIRRGSYDLICLWDVIEHLPNFSPLERLFDMTDHVALTVPIKPENTLLADWKHFKPLEHLHYFSRDDIEVLFAGFGYELIKTGFPECPPREDVQSFLFKKENH